MAVNLKQRAEEADDPVAVAVYETGQAIVDALEDVKSTIMIFSESGSDLGGIERVLNEIRGRLAGEL